MYPLDWNTCTARDVILRSIVCHDTVLADALEAQEREHRSYANRYPTSPGVGGAKSMADACAIAAGAIRSGNHDEAEAITTIIAANPGAFIVAFNAACTLQLIPYGLGAAIAVRSM